MQELLRLRRFGRPAPVTALLSCARPQTFFARDDGAGFDPAYATHLFGAFQRMHTAGQFKGDGIGLAPVQHLVMCIPAPIRARLGPADR